MIANSNYPKTLYGSGAYTVVSTMSEESVARSKGFYLPGETMSCPAGDIVQFGSTEIDGGSYTVNENAFSEPVIMQHRHNRRRRRR